MAVPFVFAFLFIAAVMGTAIHFLTRSQRSLSFHTLHNEVAWQAAESAIGCAARHYEELLNDPGSDIHRQLAGNDDIAAFPLPDYSDKGRMDRAIRNLLADYPGLRLEVVGELTNLRRAGTSAGRERRGHIRIEAYAKYLEAKRRVTAWRPFAFLSATPPVVSRFSLFVRKAGDRDFNTIGNARTGDCRGAKPWTVVSGDGADLERNGWIFLGGGRVTLNIARGEGRHGEEFHLPRTVTRSVFFPDPHYALLHVNTGFYAEASGEQIFQHFPSGGSFRSSCFRLLGCAAAGEKAAPALVVGDVWRRYIQAAAIGGVEDEVLTRIIPLPWTSAQDKIPRTPGFPPFLFLSLRLYQVYMSQTREEPYNRSVDYILCSGRNPTPLALNGIYGKRLGTVYPLSDGEEVGRAAAGGGRDVGKLGEFSMSDALAGKACAEYPSFPAFAARYGNPSMPDVLEGVTGICRIGGAGNVFGRSGRVKVSGRSLLIFDESFAVGDVALADAARDMLTLVARRGDITVKGAAVEANLVALEGTVRFEKSARVKGLVACDRLDPEDWRRGGELVYDPRLAPACGERAGTFTAKVSATCDACYERN